MGFRKVSVKKSAADSISAISWHIESKGLIATADKFIDNVYDYFLKLADEKKSYAICKEPGRASFGYKCIPYKRSIPLSL